MIAVALLSGALLFAQGTRPPDYSEKSLCELWAGAQCHAASCTPDAKERCTLESKRCYGRGRSTVEGERARQVAECAKAMLKARCGDPTPAECSGVTPP